MRSSSSRTLLFVAFAAAASSFRTTTGVHSFTPALPSSTLKSSSSVIFAKKESSADSSGKEKTTTSTSSPQALFDTPGWPPIKQDLDKVPLFTVATKEGHPLAYTIETAQDESYPVPFFYCDIDVAQKELEQSIQVMKETSTDDNSAEGLGLIPFPLGQAFELWANDKAVIVPSKTEIQHAGAPPSVNPIGQQIPMFACMDIMEERADDGKGVLPLFMELQDAQGALKEAVEADGGSIDEFEIVSLSLNRAVELLATVPDTPAFHFIPPSRSIQFIEEYLEG